MADFKVTDGDHTAHLFRTSDPVKVSGGYGGHPVAARPKKVALTIWEGRQPFQMEVPALLHKNGNSVEDDRIALDMMATVADNTRLKDQRTVTVSPTHMFPIPPRIKNAWWIENLDWGEELRVENHATLVRRVVTITFLERIDDVLLEPLRHQGSKTNLYRVKKGDTLHSIAKTQLHDAGRWKEIADLNNIRSSGQLHKLVGHTIKLPAGKH